MVGQGTFINVVLTTKDKSLTIRGTVMLYLFEQMEIDMKGFLSIASDMEREKQHGQMVVLIQVNIIKTKKKDMEYTNGKTDKCMRENGRIAINMERVVKHLQMVVLIQVNIIKTKMKDGVYINGQTDMCMKDNLKTTSRMVSEYTNGLMETYTTDTRVNLLIGKEKVMEYYTLQLGVNLKENGRTISCMVFSH